LTNKVITRRTFKQIGPIDITSNNTEYTVPYEEDGIPQDNILDVLPPSISIDSSDNLDDYKYLLHTFHTDNEDHRLYKIIKLDIINTDTDGDIIVGYRQHILQNNKLDHADTDNDVPYHILLVI
jgi:hypothetical protein